jgi:hypothetical protein
VLRGLLAVAVLLLTAVDELVTAAIGIRPLTPVLRETWQVITDEYRAGAIGAIDADLVEEESSDGA